MIKGKGTKSKKAIKSIKSGNLGSDEDDDYQSLQPSKKVITKGGGYRGNSKSISSFLENQIFNQGKK